LSKASSPNEAETSAKVACVKGQSIWPPGRGALAIVRVARSSRESGSCGVTRSCGGKGV
jgi:hypothetical protein